MKSRARKRPRVPTNPVAATALKVDPTRTLTLRRGVCTEVSKRLAKVRLQIHDLLIRQQALRFRWATLPTEGKVAAVTNWVTTLLREALLSPGQLGGSPAQLGGSPGNWWAGKLLAAYMKGASRSHDDVRRRSPQLAALGPGGKGEFLRGLVRRRALPRPVTNAYNPDQPRDNHGRWERLSDSAHRPYGSHPQERANRKPTQSPLEEGLEAGLEASNLSRHLHRLTEEFLDRVLADEGLDHAHQTAHSVRQTTTWIRPQAETTDHFRRLVERQGELAQHEKERYAGEHQELAHIHHGHASKLHGRAAYELGYLGRALGERGQGTAKDLIKRHREAAALHHDAAEMLDNTRPVTNATPYVSPDDVETYGGRLQALAHRLRNELDGVTWAAAQRIARVLHDGLDQGWGAERLAQAITDAVDSIARSRALLIANTELVRAHADGQLDALEELGEEEVTAAVEWATAGDDKVCKLCKPLDGVVLTVAEARGLIPRHVNCRCAWLPAGTRKGQEGKVMQSTLQDVTRAVKRSLRKSPANDGWFEGKVVARKRPKV